MRIIVFILVMILLIIPLVGLPTAFYFYPSLRPILKDYQTLIGSLVALDAAVIAFLGVLFTIEGQRKNSERQLSFQRQAEERLKSLRKQQIAGAFVGEVSVIFSVLSNKHMRSMINGTYSVLGTNDLTQSMKDNPVQISIMLHHPTSQLDTFYRANTIEIGQFPAPLPEQLTRFYSLYATFKNSEEHFTGNLDTEFKDTTIYRLREANISQINALNALDEIAPKLIRKLEEIRDAPIQ